MAAFLFARDKIEGRQAGFAAQELAPVAKRHLEMAVAAAPTNLWFPMKLVSWDYDFAAQAINFRVGEMLKTPKGWFDDSYTVMPPSASATANHAPMSTVDGPASQQKELRPGLPEPSGTEKWRQQLQFFAGGLIPNYGALALDRQLFLKSIPVDSKTAERLALKRAELRKGLRHRDPRGARRNKARRQAAQVRRPVRHAAEARCLHSRQRIDRNREAGSAASPEGRNSHCRAPSAETGSQTTDWPGPGRARTGARARAAAGLGTDHCRSENEGASELERSREQQRACSRCSKHTPIKTAPRSRPRSPPECRVRRQMQVPAQHSALPGVRVRNPCDRWNPLRPCL